MDGIIRLFMGIFIRKRMAKLAEKSYSTFIFFVISLLITLVSAYTIYYNLKDYGNLTVEQIFGLIIIVPLFILFLYGTYTFGYDCVNRYIYKRPTKFQYVDYGKNVFEKKYIGETIIDQKQYGVYKKDEKYYLYNRKNAGDFIANDMYHGMEIKKEDLTDVFQIITYCVYKGYIMDFFNINKWEKTATILTYDTKLGYDINLGFKQTNKFVFEK